MVNESLISRARNTLVAKFLNNPTSTHLMFIDADIGWEPWHLLVMLNRDVDVIGGLYPMKSLPVRWVVNGFEGADQGPDGLQEVSKTGTGFMLVKRHVFDKLNVHPAVKSFNNDVGLPKELDAHLRTYYDTAVRENRYYSEDWTFCENWRDIGGQVWVDKRVLLRHVGTYTFDYNTHEQLYKDLKQMFEPQLATADVVVVNKPAEGHDLAPEPAPVAEPEVFASSKKKAKKAAAAA